MSHSCTFSAGISHTPLDQFRRLEMCGWGPRLHGNLRDGTLPDQPEKLYYTRGQRDTQALFLAMLPQLHTGIEVDRQRKTKHKWSLWPIQYMVNTVPVNCPGIGNNPVNQLVKFRF